MDYPARRCSLVQKASGVIRTMTLVFILVLAAFLCVVRLLKLQIVDGSMYAAKSTSSYTASQSIESARGQIADKNGVKLNSNKIVYKVIVQKAFFTKGAENYTISKVLDILRKHNEEWIDTIPITVTEPYNFTSVSDSALEKFKANLVLNVDATAENCIDAMMKRYDISDEYDEQTRRYIAGVRYEMETRDFSYENKYTVAEDISMDTVTEIKEQGFLLSGIDVVEEPMRIYLSSGTAAHIRGTVGSISAEQYAELKEDGYSMNDTIGLSGIESAMESVLRGTDGVREITRNSEGEVISGNITSSVKAGNSVKLTIDSKFQDTVQQILENHISWLHYNNDPDRGNECDAGAVVVLDVKTGGVLAMANYPTYDLNELVENYYSVLNAENNPLYNRCINGVYRPGSTFKSITATAGLITETINSTSTITCGGRYTFFTDYQPKCAGVHGSINVVSALKWSCNIFFYDVGRRLGIDTLASFAEKFGVGTDLGLEIGGATGRMTVPELYEQLVGEAWTDGNVIQSAIGQSETLLTPLHLAVQAMTLANDGIRYKPYLVDSVWNYDMSELVYKTQKEVAETIDAGDTDAFATVRNGMIEVAKNSFWPLYSQNYIFDGLESEVAMKTGTPEASGGYYNSTVVSYYPAENPEIAIGIVLEKGEFSKFMVRNIIDAYFYDDYQPDTDEDGNIISPWKRDRNTVVSDEQDAVTESGESINVPDGDHIQESVTGTDVTTDDNNTIVTRQDTGGG